MGRKVNVSEVIGKSKLNGLMYGVIAIGVIMILFDGYDMGVWAGTLTSFAHGYGNRGCNPWLHYERRSVWQYARWHIFRYALG